MLNRKASYESRRVFPHHSVPDGSLLASLIWSQSDIWARHQRASPEVPMTCRAAANTCETNRWLTGAYETNNQSVIKLSQISDKTMQSLLRGAALWCVYSVLCKVCKPYRFQNTESFLTSGSPVKHLAGTDRHLIFLSLLHLCTRPEQTCPHPAYVWCDVAQFFPHELQIFWLITHANEILAVCSVLLY